MGEVEREGEVRKKRSEWEVVEHCSADKLMQQSRLSQQHTPSLAQCLRGLVPVHGSPGGTGSPAQNNRNRNIFGPKIRLASDT